MEALVWMAPGRLELANLPTPLASSQFALVRPYCGGICGADYHIFEGKHPYLFIPG